MSYHQMTHRCKECDCVLWSMAAKSQGTCSECAMPDEEPATCLEEMLASVIGSEN